MGDAGPIDRRGLGRTLSRVMNASVETALQGLVDQPESSARRIGFTGTTGLGHRNSYGLPTVAEGRARA